MSTCTWSRDFADFATESLGVPVFLVVSFLLLASEVVRSSHKSFLVLVWRPKLYFVFFISVCTGLPYVKNIDTIFFQVPSYVVNLVVVSFFIAPLPMVFLVSVGFISSLTVFADIVLGVCVDPVSDMLVSNNTSIAASNGCDFLSAYSVNE